MSVEPILVRHVLGWAAENIAAARMIIPVALVRVMPVLVADIIYPRRLQHHLVIVQMAIGRRPIR